MLLVASANRDEDRRPDPDRDACALSSTSTVRGWETLPITVGRRLRSALR